jgi:hypothetical protein
MTVAFVQILHNNTRVHLSVTCPRCRADSLVPFDGRGSGCTPAAGAEHGSGQPRQLSADGSALGGASAVPFQNELILNMSKLKAELKHKDVELETLASAREEKEGRVAELTAELDSVKQVRCLRIAGLLHGQCQGWQYSTAELLCQSCRRRLGMTWSRKYTILIPF